MDLHVGRRVAVAAAALPAGDHADAEGGGEGSGGGDAAGAPGADGGRLGGVGRAGGHGGLLGWRGGLGAVRPGSAVRAAAAQHREPETGRPGRRHAAPGHEERGAPGVPHALGTGLHPALGGAGRVTGARGGPLLLVVLAAVRPVLAVEVRDADVPVRGVQLVLHTALGDRPVRGGEGGDLLALQGDRRHVRTAAVLDPRLRAVAEDDFVDLALRMRLERRRRGRGSG
ncbi:hypothetical protein DEJ49_25020 [Streptomyces venezuelae]|uniref:Uncharacterized protein n=1 Tax=Streptomyces venezuelae TaxID=54571 RepID=A0A5P2CSH2_STRVZ|nr:hypothetical protein DEJ49_25020 [Streptomyces venezuelae]